MTISSSRRVDTDKITYTYDELGRQLTASVLNSTFISERLRSRTYDSLGRVSTTTNVLGSFTNSYVGATRRLHETTLPNGLKTTYAYFGNAEDRRLQTIQNLTSLIDKRIEVRLHLR